MASSCNKGTYDACGFQLFNNELDIGRALNEGYTNILAHRYFNTDISCFKTGYAREADYFNTIEKIIDNKDLEKYYMMGNLPGLIKFLSKYSSSKEVVLNLMKMDEILDSSHEFSKESIQNKIKRFDITNKIIEVNMFLSSLYFKKNGCEDLSIKNYNDYKNLYTINNQEIGKNIIMESLSIYNDHTLENLRTKQNRLLRELYKIIGYDKLEDICFKEGISKIISILSKYAPMHEVLKYLNNLNTYLDPFNSFNDEVYDIITKFHFSLNVCKSGMCKNISASTNVGFNMENIFLDTYQYKISKCLDNIDFFDNDEFSKLGRLIGKETLLRVYLSGDKNVLSNLLKRYDSSANVMELIHSNNEEFRKFIEELMNQNSKQM